ncbi:MarR family winged helix-turn-helix transcriptional regulator [Kutzneria chonburiensis]|uniref:MarR family winged helix-turn-helix transcriptional regulator n=1 Tax=Kutzneria chonburiensis TaxID=1483604 RepID=A0ABV6N7Y1_9PSEU|nr:MarR family transcriptional regulator [Kutzneria chonburiensis]
MSSDQASPRLAYLLKHANQRISELTEAALLPYDLSGKELAVLNVLSALELGSQQQAAQRLGIDRSTMVALLDSLERKDLVSRHPHVDDRRRNVVELTEHGMETRRKARVAALAAEQEFLEPVAVAAGDQLRAALETIVRASRSQG